MKIGILHAYTLAGSGSSIYVVELARHLARRGHEVHIISVEHEPHEYDLFRVAYAYENGTAKRLFLRGDAGPCCSHSPMLPVVPVAYPRPSLPQGKPFTALSDQEIKEYIALNCSTITSICRKHRLDVLHANHALLMPYIASIVKSLENIPYVVTIHGSTIEYVLRQDRRYWPYAIEGLQNADRIIGLNRDVVSRILEICPDLHSNIVEIPAGVDTKGFTPIADGDRKGLVDQIITDLQTSNGKKGKPRASYDLMGPLFEEGCALERVVHEFARIRASYNPNHPDGDLAQQLASIRCEREPLIFYGGSLRFDKGVHCLIAAMPHILERFPGCRLIIAGDGDDREYIEAAVWALDRGDIDLFHRILYLGIVERGSGGRQAYEYISSFLRTLNPKSYAEMSSGRLRDSVIFTGHLSQLHLSQLLACATVGVIPSIVKEAFPISFVEALSCGVLPVASYYGGLRPILDRLASDLGEIGELCRVSHRPECMIPGLAANVTEILRRLADSDFAERVRGQCRQLAESEHSWEIVASRTEALYSACPRPTVAAVSGEGWR